jgi:phospholipid/cholesterol/gamma-HCH transport system permease protein
LSSNPSSAIVVSPLAWIGRRMLASVAYLGAMAMLVPSALRATVRVGATSRTFRSAVLNELAWMFGMGFPLVALVHVGMGSFLCMQSYFGGTFVDGAGAVVGVGLIRNLAPMLACFTLAGLFAARITPEFLARRGDPEARGRAGFLERTGAGRNPEPTSVEVPLDRLVAARLVAGAVAGPVMSLWGAAVGIVVGWQVGQVMMGVSTHSFFLMFWDMLWLRDVIGLVIKGIVFAFFSGLFACHEGLWRSAGDDVATTPVATAACRAACFSALAILVVNSGWFILVYHAGPAFGPTLLLPPAS